ncbi:MAG: CvpA family protein, partial [Planctomycetota bacterium]
MNGFDIGLLVLLGILVVIGLLKGLARLLIGIAALVAAFVLAAQFHQDLAVKLTWFEWSDNVLTLVASLMIFIGIMLAAGLVAWLAREVASGRVDPEAWQHDPRDPEELRREMLDLPGVGP